MQQWHEAVQNPLLLHGKLLPASLTAAASGGGAQKAAATPLVGPVRAEGAPASGSASSAPAAGAAAAAVAASAVAMLSAAQIEEIWRAPAFQFGYIPEVPPPEHLK